MLRQRKILLASDRTALRHSRSAPNRQLRFGIDLVRRFPGATLFGVL